MIKRYVIKDDGKDSILKLKMNDKKNKILAGESILIHKNDFIEIYKVKVSYEMKLVGFLKKEKKQLTVFESIAIKPCTDEYNKMIINFNNFLKDEGMEHLSVKDKNKY
jgi:hypothetical protein